MDDDVYPNDGSSFFMAREPKDQIIARKKENAKLLESINVLRDVVERLEARIDFYGSVDAMPTEAKADPTMFMNMHNANELVRECLIAEKEYLQQLIDGR